MKKVSKEVFISLLVVFLGVCFSNSSFAAENETTFSSTVSNEDGGGQATTKGKITFSENKTEDNQDNEQIDNGSKKDDKQYFSSLPKTGEITKKYLPIGVVLIIIIFFIFFMRRSRRSEE